MEENPDLATQYKNNLTVKHLLDDAMLVEGIPVQTGVHAAGVIIADKPVSEYAPLLWNDEKNCWVIESDMVECEKTLGLLKMDLLGLRNLTVIQETVELIRNNRGIIVDVDHLPETDPETCAMLCEGDTVGVFLCAESRLSDLVVHPWDFREKLNVWKVSWLNVATASRKTDVIHLHATF